MSAAAGLEPARPVRLVHLGLGNFFRAHQAWYTDQAADADDWGYAAFTGRRPGLVDLLRAQGGRYTVVTRGPEEDDRELVRSLSDVRAGSDQKAWLRWVSDPQVAAVTVTVTEAGYVRDARGEPDLVDPLLAADVGALRQDRSAPAATAPGKLVAGLAARRSADAGRIAVIPCDNLMDNGPVASRVVIGVAEAVDPGLGEWIRGHVSFVSSVVDRITPMVDPDRAAAERLAPTDVVTEPFHEWILSGSFPGGRPAWERAGARFVDPIQPFEQRKLWLLNGGHSLLAYAGTVLGRQTVADAMIDDRLRSWLADWWAEAGDQIPLPASDLSDYCAALTVRFQNGRIVHRLQQIAADGTQKLPIRVLPVLRAGRAQGRPSGAATRVLGAWVAYATLSTSGQVTLPLKDPRAAQIARASAPSDVGDAVRGLLALLDPALADDAEVVAETTSAARELRSLAVRRRP